MGDIVVCAQRMFHPVAWPVGVRITEGEDAVAAVGTATPPTSIRLPLRFRTVERLANSSNPKTATTVVQQGVKAGG
ncbi:MAG: hypothetical protein IKR28_01745 [Selenomonadaceae bacterium]|nr:hypothetical protein [Selenomonadaceae bacterium]